MSNIYTISMTYSTTISWVLLTKNTRGPKNTLLPQIKARRLATQAVINKMATTSLNHCVSDTAKNFIFRKILEDIFI